MTASNFRYGDVKRIMHGVCITMYEAGYEQEANALGSLTHIIGSRIESPDVSTKWGLEYMLEIMEHHSSLVEYINDGAIDGSNIR